MIFDLRKFWLATAVYGLVIGGTIAAVGAGFYAFIGMPAKGFQQAVTPPAPVQTSGAKMAPVEVKREAAAPAVLPPSASVRPAPSANVAAAVTPPEIRVRVPQIIVPEPKIIVPEPRSGRRRGPSRSGF